MREETRKTKDTSNQAFALLKSKGILINPSCLGCNIAVYLAETCEDIVGEIYRNESPCIYTKVSSISMTEDHTLVEFEIELQPAPITRNNLNVSSFRRIVIPVYMAREWNGEKYVPDPEEPYSVGDVIGYAYDGEGDYYRFSNIEFELIGDR